MSFTRREFLKCCGQGMTAATMMTALGYAGLENAYAQGSDYKALVCIFLEGGNDGWNTIVPMGAPHSTYSSNRQGLALPLSSLLPLTFTGTAPGQFGFHPRLTGLRDLFNQGRVAVVNNVGNLAAGQTLGAGTNRLFAAQTNGTGTVHPFSGDTFTVTYTIGGTSFTQTGHF
jgi:uncharacterized protein (DUF1501 family)